MNPRRAALVGLLFVGIAAFYLAFSAAVDSTKVDYAGFVLLIALGAAMSIMAYVLFAGLRHS
jgi:peptidoglycan/LPS O-acetylase OafA/YrhL